MEGLQKPKWKRRYAAKVRTACGTCKTRRIKCGEERPHCKRCIKSGMTCDGYPERAVSKFIAFATRPLAIQPNPSVSLQLDEQEMRYFQDFVQDRFIDNRKNSLGSPRRFLVTDTFFWIGVVLQEVHVTESTRHAIVAISALVRSIYHHWAEGVRTAATTGALDPHHEFSLLQYHKAVRSLRTSITKTDDKSALVACLVLSFFDMLYGHGALAVQHVVYARQVVAHWRKKNKDPGLQLDPRPESLDNISRLLLRLQLQSTYLSGDRQPDLFADLDISKLPMEIPAKFRDIQEALYVGHLLVSRAGNFRLQKSQLEHSKAPIPPETVAGCNYFLQSLRLFNTAVDHLLQQQAAQSSIDVHPLARPSSMKIYTTSMLMRLTTGWGRPQTSCDSLCKEFAYIISMARSIIDFEAKSSTVKIVSYKSSDTSVSASEDVFKINALAPDPQVICFEYRILPFLFTVATKCREPVLRREAILLMLRTRWREGIWDSYIAGKIATWIIEMEERGMNNYGYVPESARCFGETFSLNMASRTADARCWQNQVGGGRVERKTTILW